MAVREIKDMGASVLARLKKQSKEKGINYQTCLQLFAQEEFLRRLEASRYAENFVLKGGMFLYIISHFEGRPTMDIDFMIRKLSNDISGMKKIIKEICSMDTGNAFIDIEVLGIKEITPEKKYSGLGINLMAHIKNVRIPFSVDIGVDDVIIPAPIKRTVTTRLSGFKEPDVYTYSLESTIAEKFDAILKRMAASSRMKDFYDIFYWSKIFDFDGSILYRAIFETLKHRGTVYRKDSLDKIKLFHQNEFLRKLWNNYNPGPGLEKPDFISVLNQIDLFIGPIYEAILNQIDFFGTWSAKENVWSKSKEKAGE